MKMVKKNEKQSNLKKTVFVGLSGGVDSAVSAALLQDEGFEVVGVFIRTWHPDFLECNEEAERLDAMRVSAHLDIPFLTFDFEDVYKKEVADYMIREYKAGRTPNPDVMCNKSIKFGAFLAKAISMGADFVATGHYSRLEPEFLISNSKFLNNKDKYSKNSNIINSFKIKNYKLKIAVDSSKDQSYFLWTLGQEQLARILFPIGGLLKTQVRKLAEEFGLPVAEKKDSQGICFLGEVDLKKFLKHYMKEKKGKVCNESGEVIGWHEGAVFYTLGERHGFTITDKTPNDRPYYVVAKDVPKNILFVSQTPQTQNTSSKVLTNFRTRNEDGKIKIINTNWISGLPEPEKVYKAQIRYHGELLSAKVKTLPRARAEVLFEGHTQVAPGQSVVIYDHDICLGGGVVK